MNMIDGAARTLGVAVVLAISAAAAGAPPGEAARTALLPPEIPWDGASRKLMVAAERSLGHARRAQRASRDTPATTRPWPGCASWSRPRRSCSWCRSAGAPRAATSGWSSPRRERRGHAGGPARPTGKPTLLAQAGIHAGEIDGKDAGLDAAARHDRARHRRATCSTAPTSCSCPIFNVDGHERFVGASRRINQRGPEEAGWRTTARNLNLNRDYAKLDAPETRAMVRGAQRLGSPTSTSTCTSPTAPTTSTTSPSAPLARAAARRPSARWLDDALRPGADRRPARHGPHPGAAHRRPSTPLDPAKGIVDWPPAAALLHRLRRRSPPARPCWSRTTR